MRRTALAALLLLAAWSGCGRTGYLLPDGNGGTTPPTSPSPNPSASPFPSGTPPLDNGDGSDGALVVSAATVVNTCWPVSTASGTTVTIGATTGLAAGARLLLLQVQDAVAESYGHTNDAMAGAAGTWEIVTAQVVTPGPPDVVTTSAALLSSYSTTAPSRTAQACRVPEYTNVTVQGGGVIESAPWNGSTGGVVAFLATGTVSLTSGPINASGTGFRGGESLSGSGNVGIQDGAAGSGEGGNKGEGIDARSWTRLARGNLANGAGGANDSNSGGGGGGNAGYGGRGGDGSGANLFGRAGRRVLSGPGLRLLFGGGGGGGEHDEGNTCTGGAGGGLVLISCAAVTGNVPILASGDPGGNGSDDGACGGGAGGSVFVQSADYSGYGGTVRVEGGRGGNSSGDGPPGPGGGGGGGRVYLPGGATVGVDATAGDAGTASGDSRGATMGTSGLVSF